MRKVIRISDGQKSTYKYLHVSLPNSSKFDIHLVDQFSLSFEISVLKKLSCLNKAQIFSILSRKRKPYIPLKDNLLRLNGRGIRYCLRFEVYILFSRPYFHA